MQTSLLGRENWGHKTVEQSQELQFVISVENETAQRVLTFLEILLKVFRMESDTGDRQLTCAIGSN